jgi:hypothetical protein
MHNPKHQLHMTHVNQQSSKSTEIPSKPAGATRASRETTSPNTQKSRSSAGESRVARSAGGKCRHARHETMSKTNTCALSSSTNNGILGPISGTNCESDPSDALHTSSNSHIENHGLKALKLAAELFSGNEKEEESCECPHWPKLIDESNLDQWKWELEDKVTKCMKGRHRLSLQAYVRSWFDKDQYPSYDSLGQHSVPKQFVQCMSKLAVILVHLSSRKQMTS